MKKIKCLLRSDAFFFSSVVIAILCSLLIPKEKNLWFCMTAFGCMWTSLCLMLFTKKCEKD